MEPLPTRTEILGDFDSTTKCQDPYLEARPGGADRPRMGGNAQKKMYVRHGVWQEGDFGLKHWCPAGFLPEVGKKIVIPHLWAINALIWRDKGHWSSAHTPK